MKLTELSHRVDIECDCHCVFTVLHHQHSKALCICTEVHQNTLDFWSFL